MEFIFLLFVLAFVSIWLIGRVMQLAERLSHRPRPTKNTIIEQLANKLSTGFWLFLMLITLTGCCGNTPAPIKTPSCPPMLRAATYRAMGPDERRDYRIAIEKCRYYNQS